MLALVVAASLLGLTKSVLVGIIAVINAILAIVATVSVWKAYLTVGLKIFITLVLFVPILGIVAYVLWAQFKVRDARP